MRRFTLQEGTSSKFWEIEQSGTEVTVRFGRIGTSGQTKTKDLLSDEAARAAVAKLVAEKLRKGYAEDGASGAAPALGPASPPSPATARASSPVPAAIKEAVPKEEAPPDGGRPEAPPEGASELRPPRPVEIPDEGEWTPPAAWRREVLPIRGIDPVSAPSIDVAAARALLGDRRERARRRISNRSTPEDLREAGLLALGEEKRLIRRAVEPTPTPLGEAVVAAAMLADADWQDVERVGLALLTLWWTQHPVEFVVQAVAELAGLHHEPHGSAPGVQRLAGRRYYGYPALPNLLLRLRVLLAASDDSTYERAVGALEATTTNSVGLIRAAVLAPTRRDWLAAALAGGLPSSSGAEQPWVLLLSSCQSVAEAQVVLSAAPSWLIPRPPGVITSLAAHVGPAAAPLLLGLLDDADAEFARRVIGLIAAFCDEAAFASLLSRLDRKGVTEGVLKAKELQPFRATRLLAEHAAGSGSAARTCASLLRAHLSAHPETRAVSELLAPAARAAFEKAEPQQDTRPLATVEQLPAILVEAPWDRKRKVGKPVVVAGLVPPRTVALVWAAGEQDRWRVKPQHWMTDRQSWDQALSKQNWNMVMTLAAAPRAIGRRYLSTVDPRNSYCNATDVSGLLAAHELEAVAVAIALARANPSRAAALLPVRSTEVAVAMADWLVRAKSVRPTALAWLDRHPEAATLALVPSALGKPGKERRAAERALRVVAAKHPSVVETAAASYGPEAAAGIASMLGVDPVDVLPARVPTLPLWLDLHSLPAVLLADRSARLPVDAVHRLLTCLAVCEPGEVYAGLEQALPALDRSSVAEMAWAVLESWRMTGEPAKEVWVLHALGLVGDDETARRLSPLVVAWPKENGTAKAATGLEVLASIGTDVALMHLHRISLRAPSKPLRERAAGLIETVAEELQLTPEQLADRLVPDMGLDADGRKVLDYGPRQFVVGFDESLKPFVEEGGRRRPALPKPGAKDDPELASAAYALFSGLKKDVRTVAADQLRRFEQAMASQRRWTASEQRQHFVEHPLLWHLARRLVWVAVDGQGRTQLSFRVAEDRTLADRNDAELMLAEEASVGIAHPMHLGEDLGTWTEVFADYEILQPFPQLGREVLRLTEAERSTDALTRFATTPVATKRIYGLAHRGWERAMAEDGGVQGTLEKLLPSGLKAIVALDPGIFVGMPDEEPEQKLTAVHVVKAEDDHWNAGSRLPLSVLDDITASEILRDLTRVTG